MHLPDSQSHALPPLTPPPARLHPTGESGLSLHGNFSWDSKGPPSIADVNLEVPVGQLVVVVGATGSGKTSLLTAIMGEMVQVGHPREGSAPLACTARHLSAA